MPKPKDPKLAEAIRASLPDPAAKRDKRVQSYFSAEEFQRFEELAEERGEPVGILVRNLALAALDALGR